MSENNWLRTAASAGFLATIGIGFAAAAYAVYNEYENSQNQLRYDSSRSNPNRNQNQTRRSNEWNREFSQEDNRQQLEKERKLTELREERRKQLFEKDLKEREERERERRSLEDTRKQLEKEYELRKEREKQLEYDERMKKEEEKETQEMQTNLNYFSDEFDKVMNVNTERGYFDEDFDDWINNKQKQQLKEEYRRKQQAKNLKSQNDTFNNVDMDVGNTACDSEENQLTNLNDVIDNSYDTSGEFKETDDSPTIRKQKTEAQKAAQRKKKKLRRQRKRAENAMKSLKRQNDVESDEDK